jgi:DNA helicase II / ATP-dependent DNA helicase PcrA
MNTLDKYEQAYKSLNHEQRQAVNQIDGPVMVIAGPGTGKTQILALRIANILLKTDAHPSNILCLTYTDAGVVAMKSRLASFIGSDAYMVNIHTYHSFCNTVIQENRASFSEKLKMENISDIEFYELSAEIIEEMDKNNPIKTFADDHATLANKLKSLFGTMKKEGWSSAFIKQKVDEQLELLKDDENMYYKRNSGVNKAGDFKQGEYDKAKKKFDSLVAAAEAFDVYNKKMKQRGMYDFDDMINFVINAFESDKDLLADYQEKFQYVLVDEFQDSNGTQIQLLNLLLEFWGSPNIFVVGDEDQAIFRFQGADISNIQNFINRYKDEDLSIIPLERNYRSTQGILFAAYSLIKENKERLATFFKNSPFYTEAYEKKLKSFKTEQQGKRNESETWETDEVNFLKYKNVYSQDMGVVARIKELVHNGTPANHIAVLYGKHKEAENLIKICTEEKIPYDVRYGINVLSHKIVKQLIQILKFIDQESRRVDNAQEHLFAILHHDYLGVEVQDIANIARCIKDNKQERWREIIGNKEKLFKMGIYNIGAIAAASENLNALIKLSYNLNIEELLEETLLRAGIYQHVFREENAQQKYEDLQAIATFFNFVKEETKNERRNILKNLLATIDNMEAFGLKINCEKVVSNDQGVQFRTAHASKGLEYPYVFILNAIDTAWEKKRSSNNSFSLPENMAKDANLEEEQRRLFYVAMTRAEKQLNICMPLEDLKDKNLNPSKFVVSIDNNISNEKIYPTQKTEGGVVDAYLSTLLKKPKISDELMEKRLIDEALRNFIMSASTLNKYLKCTLSFYFEQVLKVPTAKSSALAFGTMVHNVLEEIFKYINEHKAIPSFEYVIENYEQQCEKYKYSFHENQFEKRKQQGYKVVEDYYHAYAPTWDVSKFYQIEKEARGSFENIPLFGKLDKIEIAYNEAVVVDYKTGNPDNSSKKVLRPSEKEPLGGDIWRQVIFYQIMLVASNYKFPMQYGVVDFLEKSKKTDKFVREKIVPDLESIEIVKEQIRTAWRGIQNHEFHTGCGDEKCVWCNFVKDNYRKVNFVSEEGEEV